MAEPNAALVVIGGPVAGLLGKRIPVERQVRIGRDASCEIHVDVPELLRHHATVKRFGREAWEIESAHPSAGVFIDTRRVHFGVLKPGDQIAVGPLHLKLLAGERLEAEYHEEIYRLTIVDVATGLHNRRYFLEALENQIRSAKRQRLPLALVVYRLDGIDPDAHVTDETAVILRQVASKLSTSFRKQDILARLGPNEIAIALPGARLAAARALAARAADAASEAGGGVAISWATVALEATDSSGSDLIGRAVEAT